MPIINVGSVCPQKNIMSKFFIKIAFRLVAVSHTLLVLLLPPPLFPSSGSDGRVANMQLLLVMGSPEVEKMPDGSGKGGSSGGARVGMVHINDNTVVSPPCH